MISLFAVEERNAKRERLGDLLQVLDRAIDFAALARAADAKPVIGDSGRGGRPPYPTELMIRLLVVQQLYNLSSKALEYQLLDRASFQRFAGLGKQDLIDDISEVVGRQLARAGFIARGGQIIDASIVTAPVQHNRSDENEAIKRGEPPAGWNAAKRAQKDIDARWTKKHGKSYYGYKLHANTDRRWGFIRRIEVTTASVNDTAVFEAILDDTNTGKDVYADRGYAKHARETELHVRGYRAHIQRKGTAAQPTHCQTAPLRRTPVRASGADGRQALAHAGSGTCQSRDRTEGDRAQSDAPGETEASRRRACMMRAGRPAAATTPARVIHSVGKCHLPSPQVAGVAKKRSRHAKGRVIRGALTLARQSNENCQVMRFQD